MTPGAEQDSAGAAGAGGQHENPDPLTERLKSKLGKVHEELERLQAETPGPRADQQLAARVRAFVATIRDGKVRTVADERTLTDQLIADVQAIDAPPQASPIDPVQAP
jgi:hypothetical protein